MADANQSADNGAKRKPDGKFEKGNKLVGVGAGRPKDSNKKEYLNITRDFLTTEKWEAILQSAYEDATHPKDAYARDKGREFFAKRILPSKVELDFTGEVPVKIVAVEGFKGWDKESEE